ncbi:MAG: hypothetical protein GY853_01895 [PVC group bacterium]|nr:hypothetical protein [PVC group bacterium]
MAIMEKLGGLVRNVNALGSRSGMVSWKIKIHDEDFTKILGPYVNGITVKRRLFPAKKSESSFPYEATIEIISNSYVEHTFTEGCSIKIYLGYSSMLTEKDLVFKGEMITYPSGEAKEMLRYTIKAYGAGDAGMFLTEKNKTFLGKTKSMIVKEIMANYPDYESTVEIKKDVVISGKYSPGQEGETDFVLLGNMAKKWGCVCWFEFPNKFYFVDAAKAHDYNTPYKLGYRTDQAECNVESVNWKHNPSRAAESFNPGSKGLGEGGDSTDPDSYKIDAYGHTWTLKEMFAKTLDKNNPNFGEFARIYGSVASKLTVNWQGYIALKLFYRKMSDDPTGARASDSDDSGWEIRVKLNDGDPGAIPPFNAELYYESINPKANHSDLPYFIHFYSGAKLPYIQLKVNETVLTYKNGKLDSEFICSISRFA